MRMKNLALAVGLGLCLLCNINALTIWNSLYTDQQLRATFATSYAQKASDLANEAAKSDSSATSTTPDDAKAGAATPSAKQSGPLTPPSDPKANPGVPPSGQKPDSQSSEASKKGADDQLQSFKKNMQSFLTDVQFGVGRIWRTKSADGKPTPVTPEVFFYEFFGSLLTGILVSIGAPYWHDLLQALSNLRTFAPAAKAKS